MNFLEIAVTIIAGGVIGGALSVVIIKLLL